ncbi:hypothetical protein GA830_12135 [Mesorhizobium sp. NBSH29]|uniref:hypothetical protein n=1 Tax=Mesorhizobium sp. NBSH29 TaxID=2654249 RepID=UPI0018968F56|nr:hypothetical protein [Mesorhizobium sp. NBSH29]QPC87406.1 hypothetical protein GA830_12135 [Mesorhizobium sp. NBSH29]
MADVVFDLFGNPWVDVPTRRGRPPHEVSPKTRRRVSMLVALGWTNPRISGALCITLPTLHKYYFYELRQRETARDQLEARRIEMAWEMAEAGNVGALREFGRLLDRNDLMEIERTMGAKPVEADGTQARDRLGKKAVDAQRAVDADADLMADLEREAAAQNATH